MLLKAVEKCPPQPFNYFKVYKDEPYAKDILLAAAKEDPLFALSYFKVYKDEPYAKDILLAAAKEDPALALSYLDFYKNEPYADEIIENAKSEETLLNAVKKGPRLAFDYFNMYKNESYAKEILLKAVEIDFTKAFNYFNIYKNEPYANEILNKAKSEEVLLNTIKNNNKLRIMFIYFKDWGSVSYAKEILLKIAGKDPRNTLDNFEKWGNKSYKNEILNKAFEAITIANNEESFLKIVHVINILHEWVSEEVRFFITNKLSSQQLFKCIYYWREEIFTSSFNGIFKRMFEKLNDENKILYDLIKENNFEWISTFLEAAASYGRIDEILNMIPDINQKHEILNYCIQGVADSKNMIKNSVALTEIINSTNDKETLQYLADQLQKTLETANTEQKTILSIIGKYIANKLPEDTFFKNLDEKYKLPKLESLQAKELYDSKGRNIQQYFFYNDPDGKWSFKNFKDKYVNDKNWSFEDKWSFVLVSSQWNTGKKIVIFANKPEYDGSEVKKDWVKDIENNMNAMNPPIESIVVVHRWHSYHARKTIERIPSMAKMVLLWSCGWFQNIGNVLEKAPNAHIISTKWTGTMLVNDPMFKEINNRILNGQDIVWSEIRKKMDNNFKKWDQNVYKNFLNYVRPDENLWALFYKKYKELSSKAEVIKDN